MSHHFATARAKMIRNLQSPILLLEIWLNLVFNSRYAYSCNADIVPGYNGSFGSGIVPGGNECNMFHLYKGKFKYSVKVLNNPACETMFQILYNDIFNNQQYVFCGDTDIVIEADEGGASIVRQNDYNSNGRTSGNASFCLTIYYLAVFPSFPFDINCGNKATTNSLVMSTKKPLVTRPSEKVDDLPISPDRNQSISEGDRIPNVDQHRCVALIALFIIALLCILVLAALLIYFRRKWTTVQHKKIPDNNGLSASHGEPISYVNETPNSGIYTGLNHATQYQDLNGHYTALHETNRPASYLVPANYQDVK